MSDRHFFPPSQLPGSEDPVSREPLSLAPRWPSRALRLGLLCCSVALGGLIAWLCWERTGTTLWFLGLPAGVVVGVLLAYRLVGLPSSVSAKGGPVLW